MIHQSLSLWVASKSAVVAAAGLSRDHLHVLGGIALFGLLFAAHRGRKPGRCWAILLALATLNELFDESASVLLDGTTRLADSLSDTALTMLLPTLLISWALVLVMWFPAAHRQLRL